MAWLRIDDGFAQHPKIAGLTKTDRWTWLEVLLYCARFRTAGVVPEAVGEVVKRATPPFLERCFGFGLLDLDGEEYVVHNWAKYNPTDPTAAERVKRYRERNKARNDARNGNDPSRAGATREHVPSRPVPKSENRPSVPSEANYAGSDSQPGTAGDFERIDPAAELKRTLEANRQ